MKSLCGPLYSWYLITLFDIATFQLCFSSWTFRVVSGSRDATLRVWDIDTGQCLHVLMGHVAAVRCVQYDGRRVVSGAYDYMVKVWDPETETCLHTLQGHTNRVYSLQVGYERGICVKMGALCENGSPTNVHNNVDVIDTFGAKFLCLIHQHLLKSWVLWTRITCEGSPDGS